MLIWSLREKSAYFFMMIKKFCPGFRYYPIYIKLKGRKFMLKAAMPALFAEMLKI